MKATKSSLSMHVSQHSSHLLSQNQTRRNYKILLFKNACPLHSSVLMDIKRNKPVLPHQNTTDYKNLLAHPQTILHNICCESSVLQPADRCDLHISGHNQSQHRQKALQSFQQLGQPFTFRSFLKCPSSEGSLYWHPTRDSCVQRLQTVTTPFIFTYNAQFC